MDAIVLNREDLHRDGTNFDFEGSQHGGLNVTFILVEAAPGEGPRLHKHPYAEVFIVLEGQATYVAGAARLEVLGGQVVIVPPGMPHKFVNSGSGPLRQVDIHLSPEFITVWLSEATGSAAG
jgi:mannose-6-phosphate isomerase-like protein (cupin superfamily)